MMSPEKMDDRAARVLEAPAAIPPRPSPARSFTPCPKPAGRIRDAKAGVAKLLRENVCRLCQRCLATNRHHLVPRGRGQAGDDVDANLVPLCGSGTTGCHGDIEARRGDARQRLRARLLPEEIAYITSKKGAAWLDRHYPAR